jgi:4-hydroxy-2-oxoheptanedioate aldolase
VTPIVRVTTNAPHVILRYMDAGAQGAHIPLVNSGAEAEAAVASMKYGPVGTRGLGAVRAAAFGQERPLGEYAEQANRETLVIAQIETGAAVEALPAIVAVDGIDVIFVGVTDLSNSLGVPGQTGHPDVERAIERILETVAKSSCALGVLVSNAEAAVGWRERGARYIAVSLEGLIVDSSRRYLSSVRG